MEITISKAVYLATASEFVASNKELRTMLQGIHISAGSGCTKITATDGHTLLQIKDEGASNPELVECDGVTVRFTRDQLTAFRKAATLNTAVHLKVEHPNVAVAFANTTSFAVSIDASAYPDASRVIDRYGRLFAAKPNAKYCTIKLSCYRANAQSRN